MCVHVTLFMLQCWGPFQGHLRAGEGRAQTQVQLSTSCWWQGHSWEASPALGQASDR